MAEADAPREVVEAALFNLSTLRSPTVFQTADGEFYGWEGCRRPHRQLLRHLHPRVGLRVRHVVAVRADRPVVPADPVRSLHRRRGPDELPGRSAGRRALARPGDLAAADGQLACLVHLYLDWKLSGDDELLAALWPAARRALEFCWIPGGWDADRDGVMEGCPAQHDGRRVLRTQPADGVLVPGRAAGLRGDGPSPGARTTSPATAGKLFDQRVAWLDERAVQRRVLPARGPRCRRTADDIARRPPRTRAWAPPTRPIPSCSWPTAAWSTSWSGSTRAGLAGLGDLLDPDHVATTLRTRAPSATSCRSFTHHFNHMRSFVLGRRGRRPDVHLRRRQAAERPFPYFSEVMTGFEYTAATGSARRSAPPTRVWRSSGPSATGTTASRRNPFDEAECGHHYARAMASWSAFATWNDIWYDGRRRELTIGAGPTRGQRFWSTGAAFGTWRPGSEPDAVGDAPGRPRRAGPGRPGRGRSAPPESDGGADPRHAVDGRLPARR